MEGELISSDKNLMPSMVVRQQRSSQQQLATATAAAAAAANGDHNGEGTLDDILARTREATARGNARGACSKQTFDQDGLVLPRRVPHRHQLSDGQQPAAIRDLNRELKFNQARGLCMLDQKSELKRAMEKLETSRRRKEAEQERLTRRSSLELLLEERAQRIAREGDSGVGGGGQSSEPAAG